MPANVVTNSAFEHNHFYNKDGSVIPKESRDIVNKLEVITGIKERRYIRDDEDSVPIMKLAAERAIEDAGIMKDVSNCQYVCHMCVIIVLCLIVSK